MPTSSSAISKPPGPQSLEALYDRGGTGPETLGDLHDDALHRQPGLDRLPQPIVSVGVEVKGVRGEIEEQQHVGGQLARRAQGALDTQDIEGVHAAELIGDVERLGRTRELVGGIGAGERLDAQHGVQAEIPDRLEHRRQPSLFDQAVDRVSLGGAGYRHGLLDVLEVRDPVATPALGLVGEKARMNGDPDVVTVGE